MNTSDLQTDSGLVLVDDAHMMKSATGRLLYSILECMLFYLLMLLGPKKSQRKLPGEVLASPQLYRTWRSFCITAAVCCVQVSLWPPLPF